MPDVARMVLEPEVQGWFHHGPKILELVEQHKPKVCVELGTWMGASAIPVARAIRRWGGTLTCVDTWGGSLNYVAGVGRLGPPLMLTSCARNMLEAGVGSNIRLIPATTLEAEAEWTGMIDYLYVDADHAYQAVRADLLAWLPHMTPGGLLLGDDYGPGFPGVVQAWDECEIALGKPFTRYQSDPPDPDGIQLIYGTV
jgi:cephalosporin hydroxylase